MGIRTYIQMLREWRYPRSDEIKLIVQLVMSCMPKKWSECLDLTEDGEVNYVDCFPVTNEKGLGVEQVSVKMLRTRLLELDKKEISFPYNTRMGVTNHSDGNPFVVAKKYNISVALYYFKYRLLQGDIYTKVRMKKFKMTLDENCDYCGRTEDEKHMLWECERVKNIWRVAQEVFQEYSTGCVINFGSLFVGFSPTDGVLESVLTKITRLIVTRERQEPIAMARVKAEVLSHCDQNIHVLRNRGRNIDNWTKFKNIFDEKFN